MAGYIGRVVHNLEVIEGQPNPDFQPERPLFWMEYLCEEADEPLFSPKIEEALIYQSHGEADACAERLRLEHPELGFVFGGSLSSYGGVRVVMDPARAAQCRRDPVEDEA